MLTAGTVVQAGIAMQMESDKNKQSLQDMIKDIVNMQLTSFKHYFRIIIIILLLYNSINIKQSTFL